MISAKLVAAAASVAVVITLAGVVAFQRAKLQAQNAQIARLELVLQQSQDAAQSCSDSVQSLKEIAERQAEKNKAALDAANAKAAKAKSKAEKIMNTPPTAPGDDCRSAGERFNNWLADRDK